MTAAAVRDPRVRKHFDRIGWASVSQAPSVVDIMASLFAQLSQTTLPESAASSAHLSFRALQRIAKGSTWLVVLDDVSRTRIHTREMF